MSAIKSQPSKPENDLEKLARIYFDIVTEPEQRPTPGKKDFLPERAERIGDKYVLHLVYYRTDVVFPPPLEDKLRAVYSKEGISLPRDGFKVGRVSRREFFNRVQQWEK